MSKVVIPPHAVPERIGLKHIRFNVDIDKKGGRIVPASLFTDDAFSVLLMTGHEIDRLIGINSWWYYKEDCIYFMVSMTQEGIYLLDSKWRRLFINLWEESNPDETNDLDFEF